MSSRTDVPDLSDYRGAVNEPHHFTKHYAPGIQYSGAYNTGVGNGAENGVGGVAGVAGGGTAYGGHPTPAPASYAHLNANHVSYFGFQYPHPRGAYSVFGTDQSHNAWTKPLDVRSHSI